MKKSNFFQRQTELLISDEVSSILKTLYGDIKEDIKESAEDIAKFHLKQNYLADPITLARSSCYLALKKFDLDPKSKIRIITNNNSQKNKWWIYLVPIIEQQLGQK